MSGVLAGLLGEGSVYRGDLEFEGRVRIDGTLIGNLRSDDLVEVGPTGHVEGELVVAQALVAGTVDGRIQAHERVTLLETARIRGRLEAPWLDARMGCRLSAEVHVKREGGQ